VRKLIFERADRGSQQFFSYEKIFNARAAPIARFRSRECAYCTHLGRKAWFSREFFADYGERVAARHGLPEPGQVMQSVVGNFTSRFATRFFSIRKLFSRAAGHATLRETHGNRNRESI
jgi:hypothetical protein